MEGETNATEKPPLDLNKLKSTAEVAEILGLSDGGFRRWIAGGRATPTATVGGSHLFSDQEINRLLEMPRAGKGGKRAGAGRKKKVV